MEKLLNNVNKQTPPVKPSGRAHQPTRHKPVPPDNSSDHLQNPMATSKSSLWPREALNPFVPLKLINLSLGLIKHGRSETLKIWSPSLWGELQWLLSGWGGTQKACLGEMLQFSQSLHMWYKVAPVRRTKGQVTGTMGGGVTGRANNIRGGVKQQPPQH